MSWPPKRSLAESKVFVSILSSRSRFLSAEAMLCAPGMPHEMETRLIDGRVQRVYANLWPSLRDFWIFFSNEHRDKTYIVFEDHHWTYGETAARVAKAACVYRHVYGIQKGDRVAICSRNFPDFLVAWWACHLVGAVSVLVNA